jgi:hypothetical protein
LSRYLHAVAEVPDEKRMRLRYAGTCRLCGASLEAGAEAIYERLTKTVRCVDCSPIATAVESGAPGGSARREFERRHDKREAGIRARHPKLGGLILALSDDPQSTTAWDGGAKGEERLGAKLNTLASDTVRLLHDRRIPGSSANIDHIAITSTGVYVIDAKRYVGKRPILKVEGGLLRPRVEKLLVGSRDQTKLVDGVLKQVNVVRAIAGNDIPVIGVLCFIEADWPLIGGDFTICGVDVVWPKKLYPRLTADGPRRVEVHALHQAIATALPTAYPSTVARGCCISPISTRPCVSGCRMPNFCCGKAKAG